MCPGASRIVYRFFSVVNSARPTSTYAGGVAWGDVGRADTFGLSAC